MSPQQHALQGGTGGFFFTAVSLLSLVLQMYLMGYLIRLESIGCKCAMDWRRSYMMFFLSANVILNVANLGLLLSSGGRATLFTSFGPVGVALAGLLWLAGILFMVTALQYTSRLRREKCECSDALARTVLRVVAIIQAITLTLTVLLVLMAISLLLVRRRRRS